MSENERVDLLRNLSLLYMALAYGADDYLSDAELRAIVRRLQEDFHDYADASTVQDVVMESLTVYLDAADPMALIRDAMLAVRDAQDPQRLETHLRNLSHVAQADGVVLDNERGLLGALAECWSVRLVEEDLAQPLESPTNTRIADEVLHDLAFIFLVLGHGTDFELSESETRMMLRRLEEWQPHLPPDQVRAVLKDAMERYAEGRSDEALTEAIESVKRILPAEQRMAALNDLIKIANADDVFLDNEEDLINRLQTEWEVDPYANYGEHGTKKGDR